ncbi:MAG: BspA family leucine-rich repeat surface protein [Prevotella sp.]|nr:BspA family leucine-rich repeat surface protein [Prevotella sp.]
MSRFRRRIMSVVNADAPIRFADAEVKRICVDNFGGLNGISNAKYGTVGVKGLDGEVTYRQARAVTNIGMLFNNNTVITSFMEFELFRNANIQDGQAFRNCVNLERIALPEGCNVYGYLTFHTCKKLQVIRCKNITFYKDMNSMFYGCSSLTSLDVSNWNTQSVTNMNNTFYGCSSLTSLDVSGWNTQSVTNMNGMFYGCSSLTSLDVSGWNTQSVTNMGNMFYGCSSLTSLDVSNWNTQNVTNMGNMFYQCTSLTSLDVSNWNTQNVTNMNGMFYQCTSLTSLDVSNWNTQNVTNMNSMFNNCKSLVYLDKSRWDTHSANDIRSMFSGCISLTSDSKILPIQATHTYTGQYSNIIFSKVSVFDHITASDIPNVSVIGGYMFENNKILRYADFAQHQKLTAVEYMPFTGCELFEGMTLPNLPLTFGEMWGYFYALPSGHSYPKDRYIRFLSSTPPAGTKVYNTYNHIYVPDEAIETYKNCGLWSQTAVEVKSLSEWQADCDKYGWTKY